MAIYDLTIKKQGDEYVVSCPKCGFPGMEAQGKQDKADSTHLLLCSNAKCMWTLGEWATVEEKAKELGAVVAKLKSK
jgi:hypothetical protein